MRVSSPWDFFSNNNIEFDIFYWALGAGLDLSENDVYVNG